MKVVHVTVSADSSWGGPPRVIRDLAGAMQKHGVESVVIAAQGERGSEVRFPASVRVRVCGRETVGKLGIPTNGSLLKALIEETFDADLVHLHELWNAPQLLGAGVAKLLQRPYILSPHGELDEQALGHHRLLKTAAWVAYERLILERSAGIHALTQKESQDLAARELGVPVETIPNGIDLKLVEEGLNGTSASGLPGESRYVLFLSRLTASKGLDLLVEAFKKVCEAEPELDLVIAGPDEGILRSVTSRARELGILRRIRFVGMVKEPEKFRVMADAEAYVLPSLFEGMSISAIEALACGTPVVLTPGCNLPEVEEAGAGYVVARSVDEVANGVLRILHGDRSQASMRRSARELARKRFSIETVSTRMLKFYREAAFQIRATASWGRGVDSR